MPPSRANLLRGHWSNVLLLGVFAWAGALVSAKASDDSVLIPLVPLIGSFIVPFTVLVWAIEYSARSGSALSSARLVMGFAAGGALGLWPAALIEHWLVELAPAAYVVAVAAAEDVVKLLIVVLLALGPTTFRRRDGLLLGVVVGLGFAASRGGRLRFSANVWLWLGIAVLLHIGWDASAGLAALVVSGCSVGITAGRSSAPVPCPGSPVPST